MKKSQFWNAAGFYPLQVTYLKSLTSWISPPSWKRWFFDVIKISIICRKKMYYLYHWGKQRHYCVFCTYHYIVFLYLVATRSCHKNTHLCNSPFNFRCQDTQILLRGSPWQSKFISWFQPLNFQYYPLSFFLQINM